MSASCRPGRSWFALAAPLTAALLIAVATFAGVASAAQPPVGLGTANSFAVLAGSSVTNTGPTVINGDLGVSPGTSVTGFPAGKVNGRIYIADAVAAQAKSDLQVAYDDAAGRMPRNAVAADLGGATLVPGVYNQPAALGLTGTLTLDAQGDPDAVFIFQVGSSLTTASGSRVMLINGAQSCNVFWQVGSSATLGTSTRFAGTILALQSISMNDDVTVDGRALARNGAVTLINDTVTVSRCAANTTGGGTEPGGSSGGGGTGTEPGGSSGGGTGTGGGSGNGTGANGNGTGTGTTGVFSPIRTLRTRGSRCVDRRFRAVVTGRFIARVVFSGRGRVLARRTRSPFAVTLSGTTRVRTLLARVTFADNSPAQTLRIHVRACASDSRRVISRTPRTPGGFTG